jgi:hypothetical protein
LERFQEVYAMASTVKEADLAGPGIGDYRDLEQVLPDDYEPQLDPRETMRGRTRPSD